MRVLLVLAKQIKHNIRNWHANLMMVIFPILLIIILGSAFNGVFDRDIKLGDIKALYTVKNGGDLADSFKSFTKDLNDSVGVTFDETSDMDEGMKSVKNTEYSCYIIVGSNPGEIMIYKNARYGFNADLVESMLKMFSDRYSALAGIYKQNPGIVGKLLAEQSVNYVKTDGLDKKSQPGSLGYYAVAMLTLILLYGSQSGLFAIKSEQHQKTGVRILCSPTRKWELLVGKVLGCILITILQACVVILFSKFILKAYWGPDLLTIFLLVVAESIMTIGIGTGVAYLIKNDGAANGIVNAAIPVIAFFGGAYIPVDNMGPTIAKLSVASPLRWINDAMFRVIYNNDYSLVPTAVLMCLAVAAAFILASAVLSRKEVA